MELPGSSIPWLRAVGAAGAVAALVVGGAVTTAGAIDNPDGAEPAEVQVMATDAEGQWFSCDIAVDLEAGPAGAPGTLAIASTAMADDADVDAASYGVVIAGGDASEAPVGEAVRAPGHGAGVMITGSVPVEQGAPAEPPDGFELSVATDALPPLPTPSEVRPGTAEECGNLGVTVGPAVDAVPGVPAEAVPGVPGEAGAGGQGQDG